MNWLGTNRKGRRRKPAVKKTRLELEALEARFAPAQLLAAGAGPGGGPNVCTFDPVTQAQQLNFLAYDPRFTGGVRVAVGDLAGNGSPDLITAPGPGGGPDIHVYDGKTGQLIRQFWAFDPSFTGGVNVATGDVNGDGHADIIVGADAGGGPQVRVFSGKDGSLLYSFMAFDPRFTGGVHVAAGDVNGDGKADVIVGAGAGGGPDVAVFSGADGSLLRNFFAFAPAFTGGVGVAAGDLTGDNHADIIAGAGAGGGPNVRAFSGADGSVLQDFFAFAPGFTGGVHVAAANVEGDGRADILAGAGPGGGPTVAAFDGTSLAPLSSLMPFSPHFTGGCFVSCGPGDGNTHIYGALRSASGQPLAGVPVSLGTYQAVSGADGSFVLNVHDLSDPVEGAPIAVPAGDPSFDPQGTGTQTIPFERSRFDPATGTGVGNPRQYQSLVTAFIDGSMIYGSDPQRAAALRTLDGTGHLKTSPGNLLPFNTTTYFPNGPVTNDNNGPNSPSSLFVAGDVRSNENIGLTSVQTLFMREHNRLADQIRQASPGLSDEQIYQQARNLVIAEIQHITYDEYLPTILGPNALGAYTGSDPSVDPRVSLLFTEVVFRFQHSQTFTDFPLLDANGQELPGGPVPLNNATFNPAPVVQNGIDPLLRGLVNTVVPPVAAKLIDDGRNILFGPPGAGGIDLAALDIQRGRDLGIPDYNTVRQAYGLPRVTSFAQITSDPNVQAQLQQLYGSVDNIDAYVGGLAEDHAPGAQVGPLFYAVIKDQFERLRAGDRFWYQNGQLTAAELNTVQHTTLADIIARNTGYTNVPVNVFTAGGPAPTPGSGGIAAATDPTEFRSLDGTGHNLANPQLGSADSLYRQDVPPAFGDGVGSMNGANRPSARVISNVLFNDPNPPPDPAGTTALDVIWGQFLTHDLALTPFGLPTSLTAHGEVTGHSFFAKDVRTLLGHALNGGEDNVISQPITL